jgi:hypothetical protein
MKENESIHSFIHPHFEMWEICKKKSGRKGRFRTKMMKRRRVDYFHHMVH